MRHITHENLSRLIAVNESPCVSLYQPTHRRHPANKQDPIVYRNLLAEMEASLRERYPGREGRMILEQFETLGRDDRFWNHRANGLAIFASPERFEVFELERPVRRTLVVADGFHTKPLIRICQSADRYQVLCLTRRTVSLYEGNRDILEPVKLSDVPTDITDVLRDERSPRTQMVGSYGTRAGGAGTAVHHGHEPQTDPVDADLVRFFRAVDQGLVKGHSRPSGLPLLLAALPESQERFRRLSRNPFLLPYGMTVNPDSLSLDQLREQAWKEFRPFYLSRLAGLTETFHAVRSRQAGSADLSDVAKAATAGRVKTLLVEADRVIPGVVGRTSGAIHPGDATMPPVDDMLDNLAKLVMDKGGEVIVVPAERMPTDSGLAAIYRY